MAKSKSTFKSYIEEEIEADDVVDGAVASIPAGCTSFNGEGGLHVDHLNDSYNRDSSLSSQSKVSDPDTDWEQSSLIYENLEPELLSGDKISTRVHGVEKYMQAGRLDRQQAILGSLFCTKFKVAFVPAVQQEEDFVIHKNKLFGEYDIPLSSIQCIYQVSKSKRRKLQSSVAGYNIHKKVKKLEIHCKNFKKHTFGFPRCRHQKENADVIELITRVIDFASPPNKNLLFATKYNDGKSKGNLQRRYTVQSDWNAELSRLRARGFKTVDFNREFGLKSMPCCFVVPECLDIKQINDAAIQFKDDRPPAWSYSYKNGAALVRMSKLNTEQENQEKKMFQAIGKSNRMGKAPEVFNLSKLLPSVKTLQSSFEKLKEICIPVEKKEDTTGHQEWYSSLEGTHWLEYVSKCLQCATEVVQKLKEGYSVVIQEDSGRDFCGVISCLVQLQMDPDCRSIQGFEKLIQREWIVMGHKFADRIGLLENKDEQSPVFLLFMDCVWQMMIQFRSAFQYSETYLVILWDSVCLGFFESFIYNSEHDRINSSAGLQVRSNTSVWNWELQFDSDDLALGKNPLYVAAKLKESQVELNRRHVNCTASPSRNHEVLKQRENDDILWPKHDLPLLQFWSYCYLRWQAPTEIVAGGSPMEYLQQCMLVQETLKLQQKISKLQLDNEGGDHTESETKNSLIFSGAANEMANNSKWLVTSSFPFSTKVQAYSVPSHNTSLGMVLNSSNILSKEIEDYPPSDYEGE